MGASHSQESSDCNFTEECGGEECGGVQECSYRSAEVQLQECSYRNAPRPRPPTPIPVRITFANTKGGRKHSRNPNTMKDDLEYPRDYRHPITVLCPPYDPDPRTLTVPGNTQDGAEVTPIGSVKALTYTYIWHLDKWITHHPPRDMQARNVVKGHFRAAQAAVEVFHIGQ